MKSTYCQIVQCEECDNTILIKGPVEVGDNLKCPVCENIIHITVSEHSKEVKLVPLLGIYL